MDPETAPYKAIALASIGVATGLVGIIVAMVHKAKPQGMTNGNKHLLDRLVHLERLMHENSTEIIKQGKDIARLQVRLEKP